MFYFLTKAALSGWIAAIVSKVAKRSPALGALVASLPLISIMAVIWLWRDTEDADRIAVAHGSYVLVCSTLAANVPTDTRNASRRHRLLALVNCRLPINIRALLDNSVDARTFWYSVTTRLHLALRAADGPPRRFWRP
jgi:hypothetical protein